MNGNDTKKEVKNFSAGSLISNYFSSVVDKIEESVGTVKFITIIFFLIIIIPLIYLVMLPSEKKDQNQQDASMQESKNKNEARFQSPKKIGETLNLAGFDWTVVSANKLGNTIKAQASTLSDCKAPEGKEFVEISYISKNIAAKEINLVSPLIFESPIKSYAIYINAPLCTKSIQDDGSQLFNNQFSKLDDSYLLKVHFLVPAESKNLKIKFTEQTFTGVGEPKEFGYFDLGL